MLWHALRRKWAAERKGYPVNDVMQAGGWFDEATLVTSYQHADPETVRRVVLPTQRVLSSPTHNRTHTYEATGVKRVHSPQPGTRCVTGIPLPSSSSLFYQRSLHARGSTFALDQLRAGRRLGHLCEVKGLMIWLYERDGSINRMRSSERHVSFGPRP
jgi:hypothetical protein